MQFVMPVIPGLKEAPFKLSRIYINQNKSCSAKFVLAKLIQARRVFGWAQLKQ